MFPVTTHYWTNKRENKILDVMSKLVELDPDRFEYPGWPNAQERTLLRKQAIQVVDLKK